MPAESFGFANKRLACETIAPLLDRALPLRTAHLRDPVGPQIQFASESFIDEIAAAVGDNPVAFRLRYLKAPRDIAVVKAAAERAGWEPHPVAAAIANAVFDASGVRLRRAPLSPERLKSALA